MLTRKLQKPFIYSDIRELGGFTMTLQLSCASCGSASIAYPFKLTHEAVLHCDDCGSSIGTIAEMTHRLASEKTALRQGPPASAQAQRPQSVESERSPA
jgi:hypothetical protein